MKPLELDRDIQLHHIDLKSGWEIKYHQFYQVDPEVELNIANCPGGDYWELFKATLLVLENGDVALDLGWAPEADAGGSFWLRRLKRYDYTNPLDEFSSRDPLVMLNKVHEWMS